MSEKSFERHRQPWRPDEIQKLHTLAKKGMALKAIAKALTRSEESVKQRAKQDGLSIAKLRLPYLRPPGVELPFFDRRSRISAQRPG